MEKVILPAANRAGARELGGIMEHILSNSMVPAAAMCLNTHPRFYLIGAILSITVNIVSVTSHIVSQPRSTSSRLERFPLVQWRNDQPDV